MSAVRFLNKFSLMAQNGNDAEVVTDPVPTNGLDHQDARLNLSVLDGTGGTSTLSVVAESSNDGIHFSATSAVVFTGKTAPGLYNATGDDGAAFVRYKVTLQSLGGSAGDLAWMTCDLHVNFTQT